LSVATDNEGKTPLHLTCHDGHLDIARYLLTSHAANLEATDNEGETPLHCACLDGEIDVVQELVARGADLFATAAAGSTAFDYAFGDNNVMDYLLHAYVDKISAREGFGSVKRMLLLWGSRIRRRC